MDKFPPGAGGSFVSAQNKEFYQEEQQRIAASCKNMFNMIEIVKNEQEDISKIFIHVTGAVNNEGVVEIKEGSRIADAVDAANGFTEDADISQINLAYQLEDGQKIYIPRINDEKINGEEKIHQGADVLDENGKVYWKRHSPVLFPIVGKLKKNQTLIGGRTYEMRQHGFARDMEFEPITKLDNFHSYVLKSNPSTLARYPYDFELYNTYRLDGNKLTTMYRVINTGLIAMPFGIGGHPAFKIDANELKSGNYYLEFEENEEKIHFLYLVDGLVGTEYAKDILVNKRIININSHTFDNDAIIMKGITNKKISLKNKHMNKPILTMTFDEFTYLGIWSKPGAPFICIEPWLSTADNVNSTGVFTQKQDIILLKPNDTFECKYTVEFF